MEKLTSVVGATGESGIREWDPTPMSVERLAEKYAKSDGFKGWEALARKDRRNTEYWVNADAEIQYIKSRILEYNRKVVPYQLRKTLHHQLLSIQFSSSSGKCFPAEAKKTLHSEEDMQNFLSRHVESGNHRALWFTISNTGKDYKAGVVDIDFHHFDANEKEEAGCQRGGKATSKRRLPHPDSIQRTRIPCVVWKRNRTTVQRPVRHQQPRSSRSWKGPGCRLQPAEAIAEGLAHIELEDKSQKTWAMYLGMHYKPNQDKKLEDDGFPRFPVAVFVVCH